MDMKRINSGKLRAVGYDSRQRVLRVEFSDGSAIEHLGVGDEVWRGISSSSAAWSYYRDNVEEEFSSRRASACVSERSTEIQSAGRPVFQVSCAVRKSGLGIEFGATAAERRRQQHQGQ